MYTMGVILQLIVLLTVSSTAINSPLHISRKSKFHYDGKRAPSSATKTMCMVVRNTLRAKHKSCFLRPDNGPCRADIIQYYYDAKQKKCYQFFWGGCQGNGNRFDSSKQCIAYCMLNSSNTKGQGVIPSFCSLTFDYGSCYGQYYRWGWDKFAKSCKRRLYSGCGGNQNNFETEKECLNTCLRAPSNTLERLEKRSQTTCASYYDNKAFNID